MTDKNSKDVLEKAYDNAIQDRDSSGGLLEDLWMYIEKDRSRYQSTGHLLGKLLDTKMRTTDQLIKIGSLLQKENVVDEEDYDSPEALYKELEKEQEFNK